MNQGRIVQAGKPRELYKRPSTEFAASFLGSVTLIAVTPVARDGRNRRLRGPEGMEIEVADVPAAFPSGEAVQLGIRSELMRLHPVNGPPPPDNPRRGRIQDAPPLTH